MSIHCYFRLATGEEIALLEAEPERIVDFLETRVPESELELGQSWHGVHFLLSCHDAFGTQPLGEPPLDFIGAAANHGGSGTPIGDVDVGYGPARAFPPSQLAAIVAAMQLIASNELTRRFEQLRCEILPPTWGREPPAHELAHVTEALDAAKAFLAAGVARNLGLIVFFA